ncbi:MULTISPECIES: hypothetical protein [unclassified Pantoea]|uniref:hypothetical protein n=1 Tax=unclassified Pantoea TaxID=2630326 RepID=UPI001CD50B2B|nr:MULTISPECIES: hypothetical protein [unclassified Pantoea]MCA1179783.1 hypothetical protein [Pantoea sp. alder69]MCA1253615.1 hypothetical protein [Pantoea sp. alder70]MCA1268269.1 hypothetical protein [Pantoea sp. alder81]
MNDPICPVMDAGHPAQNIVTFMNYECIHFRPPDVKLGNLLKAYPQIAITNKLISYGSDGSIAFTRMALAVWQHQSEKFDAFHLALIAYEGMIDCYSIRAAMRAADVHFTRVSPDTLSPQAFNRSLIMKLGLTEIPSLLIGDNVLTGSAKYSELEGAVNAAPKSS